jgi:hypothetical protein
MYNNALSDYIAVQVPLMHINSLGPQNYPVKSAGHFIEE